MQALYIVVLIGIIVQGAIHDNYVRNQLFIKYLFVGEIHKETSGSFISDITYT